MWTSPPPVSSSSWFRNHGNAPVFSSGVDPGLMNPNLRKTELPYQLNSDSLFYQNQDQFSAALTHYDAPGAGQDDWGPLESPLSQTKPLGSMPEGVAQWNPSFAEDICNTQMFPPSSYQESYPDTYFPQVFSSPTTPGPSPQYPQSPAISSPSIHPRNQSFYTETHAPNSFIYPLTFDPGHLHQPSQHLLLGSADLIPERMDVLTGGSEMSFCPQGRAQSLTMSHQSSGGGACQSQTSWMKMPQHEVLSKRLFCTVCNRDFRSLPALHGHMGSHRIFKSATTRMKKNDASSPLVQTSVSMVMPVSVPVQSRATPKVRRRGAALYQSMMNLGNEEAVTSSGNVKRVKGHYTPPPMLCPLRAGPGLFCSLISRRRQRAQTVQLQNNVLIDDVAMETPTTETNKPRINLGRSFQAEIPPQREHGLICSDSQNALLLWMPQDELEEPNDQQRVTALMTMARSSVMPGGGASPEYALYVLSESKGDFLTALEKLLSTGDSNRRSGGRWSPAEMASLVKSLQLHHKDFNRIQKKVQSKSVSECVEFYYLWKKKLNLRTSPPVGLT